MNRKILIQLGEVLEDINHILTMKTIIGQGEIYLISKLAISKVTIMSSEIDRQTKIKGGKIISFRTMSKIVTYNKTS